MPAVECEELMHDVVPTPSRRLTYLFSHTHTDQPRNERPDIELRVCSGSDGDARVFTISILHRLYSKLAISCWAAAWLCGGVEGWVKLWVFVAFQICFAKHFRDD